MTSVARLTVLSTNELLSGRRPTAEFLGGFRGPLRVDNRRMLEGAFGFNRILILLGDLSHRGE